MLRNHKDALSLFSIGWGLIRGPEKQAQGGK
jgi:hypothetical protein